MAPHAPTPRSLTLRDVSLAAGVSEMTASRALRGRPDVSPATRARVEEAARALGYVPNRIAGALASRHGGLVAVVVPSFANMVFPEVLAGVSEGLDGTSLQPVVGVTGYDPAAEERVLREMLAWRPAGVIVAGLEHSEASRAMLRASGVPVVEVMDVDGPAIDAVVGISHARAGREMAEAVLARGYRRVGVLGTQMPLDHRARKRLDGFQGALAKAGVPVAGQELYAGGSALLKGREMTAALLARAPDLDFLYFSNDLIGAGGLLWLLERGRDVPHAIGLAGFNNVDLLDGLPVRLATTDACRREIGRRAAALVAARVADPGLPGAERVELAPTLQPGGTLRPL